MMTPRLRTSTATVAAAGALLLTAACTGSSSLPSASTSSSSSSTSSAAPSTSTSSAPSSSSGTASSGPVTFSTLTGVSTRLTVNSGFLSALRAVGGDLTATEGATSEQSGGDTTFVFPVTGGSATVDPSGGAPFTGSVEHSGGLQLSALGQSTTIDGFVLDGQRKALTAMVGGQRVPLLPLSTSDAKVTRQGDQVQISDDAVSFDPQAASQLAGQLKLPSLPSVQLGSLQVTLTGS